MDVIRYFFIFYFLCFFNGFGQKSTPDTSTLSLTSKSILEKKIDFYWQGGTLAQAIKQLHQTYGFKFSHAGQQINFAAIKPSSFKESPFGEVLSYLLKDSKFDYLIVGRMVVIVKKKSIIADTAQNQVSKADYNNTNLSPQDSPKKHIYTGSLNLERLTWFERRTIYRTFQRELEWAERSSSSKSAKDSLSDQKPKVISKEMAYPHFLQGSLGMLKPLLNYRDNISQNWHNEMQFKQSTSVTLSADLNFGWVLRYFMIGTGLGAKRISTQTSWVEVRDRRPLEIIKRSIKERYDIVTVPIQALAYQKRRNLFMGAGLVLKINFVELDMSSVDKFENYYEDHISPRGYSQKVPSVGFSSAFIATAGIFIKDRFILSAAGEYEPYWSPLEKNSIYNLYPHQLSFKVGLTYLINFLVIK